MSVEERMDQIVEETRRRTSEALQEFDRMCESRFVETRRRQARDVYVMAFMLTVTSISLAVMTSAIVALAVMDIF